MDKTALIVGSVAYDIIFSIHGNMKNELHIKDGELQRVNMMFTAKDKVRYFGGTAGNIAYGAGLLRLKPYLFSLAGDDFEDGYAQHLEKLDVNLKIVQRNGKFTATFYGISDEDFQQIGIFQPNAYYDNLESSLISEKLSLEDLNTVKVAIFSPGTGESTRNHMLEVKKILGNKVLNIFDPSQVLSILFTPEILKECLSLSEIFIGNETEVKQMETLFKYSIKDILNSGVKYVIETKGGDGTIIHTLTGETIVPPIKPKRIVETTGAGDAFRSGLLYGLINDLPIVDACKVGSYMGAKNVEEFGGQLYSIDLNEVKSLLK